MKFYIIKRTWIFLGNCCWLLIAGCWVNVGRMASGVGRRMFSHAVMRFPSRFALGISDLRSSTCGPAVLWLLEGFDFCLSTFVFILLSFVFFLFPFSFFLQFFLTCFSIIPLIFLYEGGGPVESFFRLINIASQIPHSC